MNKIIYFLLFISCLFSLYAFLDKEAPSGNDPAESVSNKPNFILIVADDLGFADLGFNGSNQIKTPNIDQLAREGLRFSEGYASSSVCSPSRAGLMTGINQVKFGHRTNPGGNEPGRDPEFSGLPLSQELVSKKLKKLGYINGIIGKWHLGDKEQFHPLNRGFDEFWGYTGGGHDYFLSSPDKLNYQCPIECNYKKPDPITYLTDDKGYECVEFIKRHKENPFFLFASFNAPHAPMQATEEDLKLYEHIDNETRRTYAAMVHRLDINIGKIINAVNQEGLRENTMIVFISDNGGPTSANGSINAPYNGQKGTLLEGGIRVPFVMNWPKKIEAGKVYGLPVSTLDIAPTFLALAGREAQEEDHFDGVNLFPFIMGEDTTAPHQELKWRFSTSAAIRNGGWKLVRLPDRLPLLYYLPTDTSEQNNISLQNIEKTEELLKKLGKWDVSLPHPVFSGEASHKSGNLKRYDLKYQLKQPK